MSIVCLITAKGDSYRLPGKNKLELDGVPLWERAAKAAREAKLFDKVIVSSDDPEIIASADWCYHAHHRKGWLADPKRTTFELARHIAQNEDAKELCLLLPTSPLRTAEDIRAAYAEWNAPNPYRLDLDDTTPLSEEWDGLMSKGPGGKHDGHVLICRIGSMPVIRRRYDLQDKTLTIREQADWDDMSFWSWLTPPERSCDVNTQDDFDRAREMLSK